MPIPKKILEVERPINTVVIAYGKNKDKYAVRKRIGCKKVGNNNVPINGPTIGHIINYKYVEIKHNDIKATNVDLKDYGNIYLCDSLFNDIFEELLEVYSYDDSIKIYCMAILRVCYPGIKDYELKERYDDSFLSEFYKDVPLSKNTVSTFLNNLGKACSRIFKFMSIRCNKVKIDHHLLIDGTLKSDESNVNSLSNFSRKALTKNTRDISIIYAFDLEENEPICSEVFPGNMLDQTAYERFISDNQISKGIIVADKGFPSNSAIKHFEGNKNLHYLNPLKRNSKLINNYNMIDYETTLKNYSGILAKKAKVKRVNKWLYSFKDTRKASLEEYAYLEKARINNNYDNNDYLIQNKKFGTIVFECDLDLPLETVYKAYTCRWQIELVMGFYKTSLLLDETRVQDDYSVIGSEFINFLSSLLTYRLINKYDSLGLLEKYTFKYLRKLLERAKKIKLDKNSDWMFVKMNPSQLNILKQLGIIKDYEETVKRKRGRPPTE